MAYDKNHRKGNMKNLTRLTLLCGALSAPVFAQNAQSTLKPLPETKEQRDKRMDWFRDSRFGLFIHWGVYAVPAGEWNGNKNYGEWFMEETKMPVSQYEKFADQFNPTKFNAEEWVKLAKDAGMKYIVITSKHHDGFGIFKSQLTDWDIERTPFKRDPLKELAAACQKEGIKLCFYHSIMDWHHPDWGTRRAWHDKATGTPDMDRYTAYMKGQLKELLTNYGPIGIMWFDGEWESPWTNARGVDVYNYVRSLQPNIIINNRIGKGRSGMQGMDKGEGVGDYGTPEQEIPPTGFGPGVDWESCMTMNNHWGYNKHDNNWKSTQTLVRNLIDCASKGGNYLLNVGPTAEGLIPGPSVERLKETGAWMKGNKEAIYETTASPFKKLNWGRATKKSDGKNTTLYLHVWNWPTDGKLVVPGLKNAPRFTYLMDSKTRLTATQNESSVTIDVPKQAPNAISSTVVLVVSGAPIIEEQILTQNADGTLQLSPGEAIAHGQIQVEQKEVGKDNLGFWLRTEDYVEWNFKASRPGKYEVTAEVAAPEATSLDLVLGQQKVRATIPQTGDYAKFQKVTLGTIEIAAPGNATLQLKTAGNWNPINLRALNFKPVQ
jgi:alpha-L-fucosidase